MEKNFSSGSGFCGSNGGGSLCECTFGLKRARYTVLLCNAMNGNPKRFIADGYAIFAVFLIGFFT